MTRQWTRRSWLAAVILLCMALGAAVSARQREDTAALRDRLRERYDVLSLQDGVGLVPRARDAGIRIIEVRNGAVSVDGQALTGGELRARLGADADLILRVTYLDAADQRQLAAAGQADPPRAPELPGAGPAIVAPPATPEVPGPGRPDVPRSTRRGGDMVPSAVACLQRDGRRAAHRDRRSGRRWTGRSRRRPRHRIRRLDRRLR